MRAPRYVDPDAALAELQFILKSVGAELDAQEALGKGKRGIVDQLAAQEPDNPADEEAA